MAPPVEVRPLDEMRPQFLAGGRQCPVDRDLNATPTTDAQYLMRRGSARWCAALRHPHAVHKNFQRSTTFPHAVHRDEGSGYGLPYRQS